MIRFVAFGLCRLPITSGERRLAMQETCKAIMFAVALASYVSPALPNSPRACLDQLSDPKGPLPRMDADNVIYRSILFRRDKGNYDVETFSDMSPVGSENCFRWEIVNGTKPHGGRSPEQLIVDHLTWPVAGIRVSKMRPGDDYREFNRRREQIGVKKDNNLVHAFESDRTPTLSWMANAPQSTAQAPSEPLYKFFRTGELLPALDRVESSIREAFVTSISFGKGRAGPPEISQVVGFGGLAVNVTSRVATEGNGLVVTTNTSFKYPAGMDSVRVNLPALAATRQIGPKAVGDASDAARFLEIFRDRLKNPEPVSAESNFRFVIAFGSGDDLNIFRTRQPVVVTVGDERHCYLVSAYTPIPVGLTLDNCW
jgi:hypothetical protein